MIERTIILPLFDNRNHALTTEVTEVLQQIVSIAGGYSQIQQNGVWIDNGHMYTDTALRILVTCDANTDSIIQEHLQRWRNLLRQECLYTHTSSVTPTFVTASEKVA